jgi:hypothetical protein
MKKDKTLVTILKCLPLIPVAWVITYLCLIHPDPNPYARPESVHHGLYCSYAVCRLPGEFWRTIYAPLIRLDRFLYPDRWTTRTTRFSRWRTPMILPVS